MQQLNPSEISALIKQRIGDLDTSALVVSEPDRSARTQVRIKSSLEALY
jgi:hypothetical protein